MKYKDATIFLLDFLFLYLMTVSRCSRAESLLPREQEGTQHKPNPFLGTGAQLWPWASKAPHRLHSVVDSLVDDLLPFNTEDIDRQSAPEKSAAPTYPIEVVQWTEKKQYPIQDSDANTVRRKKMKVKVTTGVKGRDPGWLEEHSVPQLLVRLQTLAHSWGEMPPGSGRDAGLPNESSNPVNGYRSINTIHHQENDEFNSPLGNKDNKLKKVPSAVESEAGESKNEADTKDSFKKTEPCIGGTCSDNKQGKGDYEGYIRFLSVLGTGKGSRRNQETKDDENEVTVLPPKYAVPGNGAKGQKDENDSSQKWEHLQGHIQSETNVKTELDSRPTVSWIHKNEKEQIDRTGDEEKSNQGRPVFTNTDVFKELSVQREMDRFKGSGAQEQIGLKNKVQDKNETDGHDFEERTDDGDAQHNAIKNNVAQDQGDENRVRQEKPIGAASQDTKKVEDRHVDDSIDSQNRNNYLSNHDGENSSAERKESQTGAVSYREPDTRGYNETPPKSSDDDIGVREKLAHRPKSQEAIIMENSQTGPGLVVELQTQSPKPRTRRNSKGQTQKSTEAKNEDGQGQSGKSTSSSAAHQETTAKPNTEHTKMEAVKAKENTQSPGNQGENTQSHGNQGENTQSPGNQGEKHTGAGNVENVNGPTEAWEDTGGEGRPEQQKQAQTLGGDGLVDGLKSVPEGDMNGKMEGSTKYDVSDRAHPKRKDDASPRVFLAFLIFFIVLFFIVTLVIRSVYNPNSGLSRANSRTALYQPNAMY